MQAGNLNYLISIQHDNLIIGLAQFLVLKFYTIFVSTKLPDLKILD
jgi:hypothetical protein